MASLPGVISTARWFLPSSTWAIACWRPIWLALAAVTSPPKFPLQFCPACRLDSGMVASSATAKNNPIRSGLGIADRPAAGCRTCERFARVVIANGGLPAGEGHPPKAFRVWQKFAVWSPVFPVGRIVASGCVGKLSPEVRAAMMRPFPATITKRARVRSRALSHLMPATQRCRSIARLGKS